jgi:hypothetical protein
MSAGTNAFGARAGFNQSGGAYFMCVQALDGAAGVTGTYINQLTAAPTGSGGAVVAPTLALVAMSTVIGSGTTAANASTIVGTGKLLKDMGKTVVSAGRVFRKFAPVVSAAGTVSSFGVVGAAGSGANAGYGSFYIEVGREGQGPATPAPILRYF